MTTSTDTVRLLVVDDDPSILTLIEEAFSKDEGLSIITESDSQAAYDLLATENLDILITDLVMPQIDGLMLLQRAISIQPNILVVIITGYASLETTLAAIHGGAYDYITKPFRLDEFRLLVKNATAHVRLLRENTHMRRENQDLEKQIDRLERINKNKEIEIERRGEELARFHEMERQNTGETAAQSTMYSYLRMLETQEERYEREIRHLEEIFSSGRLSSEEFELARQSLKTVI